jgi:hypothetical protein
VSGTPCEERQDDKLEIHGFKLSPTRKIIPAAQYAVPPVTRTAPSAMVF